MKKKLSNISVVSLTIFILILCLSGIGIKSALADDPRDISSSVKISNQGFYKNIDSDGKNGEKVDQIYAGSIVSYRFNFEIDDPSVIEPGNYFTGKFQAASPNNSFNVGLYFMGRDVPIYTYTDKGNVEIGTAYIDKTGSMRFVLSKNVEGVTAIENGLFFIKYQAVNTTENPAHNNIKPAEIDISGDKGIINIQKRENTGGSIPYRKGGVFNFNRSDKDNIYIDWQLLMNPASQRGADSIGFIGVEPKEIEVDGKVAYKAFVAEDHLGKGQVFDQITDFGYSPNENGVGDWGFYRTLVFKDKAETIVDNEKSVEAINRILRIREKMYDAFLDDAGYNETVRDDSTYNDGYSYVKLDPETKKLTLHLNAVEWAQTDHFKILYNDVFSDDIYRISSLMNEYSSRISKYISEDDFNWIKETRYLNTNIDYYNSYINLGDLLGRAKHWKLSYDSKATNLNQLWYTNTADASIETEQGTKRYPAPMQVENLIAGGRADVEIGTLLIKKVVQKNGSINPDQPLEGVEFALCDYFGNEIKGVDHVITDKDGCAKFTKLNQYYYSIKEISAPDWIDVSNNQDAIQISMPTDKGLYKVVGNHIKTTKVSARKIWKDKDPSKRPELYLELQRRIKGGAWEKVPDTELKNTINPWGGDKVDVVWRDIDEFAYGGKPYEFKVVEVDSNGDVWEGNKDWQKPKIKQINKGNNKHPAFNVVNAPKNKTLRLTKQGKSEDGNRIVNLAGAQFQLYVNKKADGSGKYTKVKGLVTTNKKGVVDFKNLSDGYYKIEETIAPAGYQKVEPIVVNIEGNYFRVSDDGGETWRTKDDNEWIELNGDKRFEFSVEDQRALTIPVSGSSEGLILKLAAFVMSAVSGLFFYSSKYKTS